MDKTEPAPLGPSSRGRHNFGANIITARGEIFDHVKDVTVSRNMQHAHFKTLRFFRKCCRLVPTLINVHQLWTVTSPVKAKLQLAKLFRQNAHIRTPGLVDQMIKEGHHTLAQSLWHYNQSTHILLYLHPDGVQRHDRGFSYLDDEKYQGKSGFLTDFYRGSRPNY
eukprot:CAMPEP_0115022934 /NCGR_PEP_ID=MMETSP0216-20121206/31960_1 /TAXON_ID=223996 /ORGANISM="Protocruzia adherens, Strain Boccale" /LENGTH=165 /DNA_ID=CAMNT_0002395941 /DNA_START=57 /DNA_END=554 /DNA_ORIENTATION=-